MEKILLRALRASDADAMVRVLGDPELYRFTGGEPPSADGLARQYAALEGGSSPSGDEQWLNWVVLVGDRAEHAGYVQATLPTGGTTAEVAWVIGTRWQGRGLAVGAAHQMAALLRDLGVETLVAHIHPGHLASNAVARRLGMHPTDVVLDGEVRWQGPCAPSVATPPDPGAPSVPRSEDD